MLPFVLADAPRLQMEYLSRHPAISEEDRAAIRDWLDKYNAKLVAYLRNTHGDEAVKRADALSRMAAQMLNRHGQEEFQKREDEIFDRIAEMFYEEE